MQYTGPRQNSGSPGAKKVSDGLENDTKANFPENFPGKMRFQKKRGHGPHAPPTLSRGLKYMNVYIQNLVANYLFDINLFHSMFLFIAI